MKETLEKAVELIGYGQELPEDEAIGVSVGWWPCFASPSGAYVKLNPDGTGTIITGAQENGTGAVMAMPKYVAEQLGMQPEDFSLLYQDTDAAPSDMGSCGSQTTFNSGRAVIAAAVDLREQLLDAAAEQLEAATEDLELAGRRDPRQGLAGQVGHDRRRWPAAAPSTARARARCRTRPRRIPAEGCVGRLGLESFHAPQLIAHAVRVRVDRGTGVVRVLEVAAAHDCGTILNRIGADGQVYGGVVMGIGQALSEGTQIDADGRQRNAHLTDYKLVTASDAPQIDIAWIETDTPNAGPKGSKGVGEPPCVPTAGAIANAIAKVIGARVHKLPMTPERVWEARRRERDAPSRTGDLGRGRARGAGRRRAPRRRRHRPRRRRPRRASRRCRRASSRSTASTELRGHRGARRRRPPPRRARQPRGDRRAAPSSASASPRLADACGDRRLPRDTRPGHDRRQPDERLAGDGDRRAALCFDATATLQSGPGRAQVAVADLFDRPRPDHRARPDELLVAVELPAPARRHRQRLRPARVPPADGDRRRRRDRRRHPRRRHGDRRAGRDDGARADDPARARGRGGADRQRRRRRAHRGGAAAAAAAAATPISDVRGSADYRRAMAAVIARRAIEAACARRVATSLSPRAPTEVDG